MKTLRQLTILALCFFSLPALAQFQQPDTVNIKPEESNVLPISPFSNKKDTTRGVFGFDNRKDVTKVYGYDDLVRATAVMVPKDNIRGNKLYTWSLEEKLTRKLGSSSFSSDVKFLDQPTASNCTGFLIAPRIIATAGHCLDESNYKDWVWLFDYTNDVHFDDNGNYIIINPDNVYEVDYIMSWDYDDDAFYGPTYSYDDYAFLRLKRSTSREPYTFRTGGEVSMYQDVYTIGAPSGLPLKLADNSYVFDTIGYDYFRTTMDVFPGNSGGPAFSKTGFLEGIVVRTAFATYDNGENYTGDYYLDEECSCIKTVKFFWAYSTAGSHVQRIEETDFDILIQAIYENIDYAIQRNDHERLDQWLGYSWILNEPYTIERGRLENVALEWKNDYALQRILAIGGNYDMVDANGRTLYHYAIANKNADLIELLWDNGVDINKADNNGAGPIHWAMQSGDLEMLRLVLQRGAKTSVNDLRYGNAPLHDAVSMNNLDMASVLIDNGASLDLKNSDGCTPYKYAKELKYAEMKTYLKMKQKELK